MAGAKVAHRPNSAMPVARLCSGNRLTMREKAMGISAPPVKPCNARKTIMLVRFQLNEQSTEATMKAPVVHSR
ncbi:hypothetical protein D3C78_964210 [compost metagenome]